MQFKKLSGYSSNLRRIERFNIKWDGKSRSKFQFEVKQFLKPFWKKYVCYEEMILVGTRYSLDIVNMSQRIAVEVHGDQHQKYTPFFHNNSRLQYADQIKRDLKKREWCEINNILLVEIYTSDLPMTKEWFKENYEIILA